MSDVSFLIITYYLDFDLLKQHLDSVRLYLKNYSQYPFTVVLNDDIAYLPELENILSGYPDIQFKLLHKNNYSNKFVDPLWNNYQNTSQEALKHMDPDGIIRGAFGFYSQQILKLVAPLEIDTEYCVINDTKSVLIENLPLETFISNDKIYTAGLTAPEKKDKFLIERAQSACCALNLDLKKTGMGMIRDFGTPFIIKTSHARGLINWLERQAIFVNDLIYNNTLSNMTLEFFLYSAWIEKNCKDDYVRETRKIKSFYTQDKLLQRKTITA